MPARIATGLVVFESTNTRNKTPLEFAIIWGDSSIPKTPDETLHLGVKSLFLRVGAVCEVLFLANEPGRTTPQRAYCVVDGKQGRFEWFGEARPPPGYGTVLGIYTARTMDVESTKEVHDKLLTQAAEPLTLKITSLKWALRTIIRSDFFDRIFMPWLPRPRNYQTGDKSLVSWIEYMEDFATDIKRDFYQNGQGVVSVYVANTEGPSSDGAERAGNVCVSYVNRSVGGVQMERVRLSRVPRTPSRGY